MDALRIAAAPAGVYRLRGKSPTVYYLDLRHPDDPLFLRIPNPGSNAMDFDWRWQSLRQVTSYTRQNTVEGVVRVGAVHKLERSPGPWDTPWVRATALETIEVLSNEEEVQLLTEFPQVRTADEKYPVRHRRPARRSEAENALRSPSKLGPGHELDEPLELTVTQPDVLASQERRDRIERIAHEIATDWREVLDRLGGEDSSTPGLHSERGPYRVRARRWEQGWELHVEGLGVTQAPTLDRAEHSVRAYIETTLGTERLDDAEIVITVPAGDLDPDRYTYIVQWSVEDDAYVGTVEDLPSLSWTAASPGAARRGIRDLVENLLMDMVANGKEPPTGRL